jgi:hypothetical protein
MVDNTLRTAGRERAAVNHLNEKCLSMVGHVMTPVSLEKLVIHSKYLHMPCCDSSSLETIPLSPLSHKVDSPPSTHSDKFYA